MLIKALSLSSVLVFAIACGGGGSGVSGSKRLGSLSDAEARQLCEYASDEFGPPRTITCNGQTIEFNGIDDGDCATAMGSEIPETCPATVSQYEDCIEAIGADPCVIVAEVPPAVCAFLADPACND